MPNFWKLYAATDLIDTRYQSSPSAPFPAGSTVDPVQGLVLPGGGVADRFEVREDRGAGNGGVDFALHLFEEVMAPLHGPVAGHEHVEGYERSAAGTKNGRIPCRCTWPIWLALGWLPVIFYTNLGSPDGRAETRDLFMPGKSEILKAIEELPQDSLDQVKEFIDSLKKQNGKRRSHERSGPLVAKKQLFTIKKWAGKKLSDGFSGREHDLVLYRKDS